MPPKSRADADPDDFRIVADDALIVYNGLSSTISKATAALDTCGGMAGSDSCGRVFGTQYDQAVSGEDGYFGLLAVTVNAAGALHVLLYRTAANIEGASNGENYDSGAVDATLNQTPDSPISVLTIASSVGEGISPPTWWSKVSGYVGLDWPDGDLDKLTSAADSWRTIADDQANYRDRPDEQIIAEQTLPSIEGISADVRTLRVSLEPVCAIATNLESMCTTYGDGLRRCRKDIDDAYTSAVADEDDDDDQLKKAAAKIKTIINSFEGTLTAFAISSQKVASDSRNSKKFLEPIAMKSPFRVDLEASESDRDGEAPMTAAQVRDTIKNLPKGTNRGVYVVSSEEELRSLYDRLSQGGVEVTPDTGYYKNGHMVRLPDGTTIGIRPDSGSGGATLDIVYPNRRKAKVHIE